MTRQSMIDLGIVRACVRCDERAPEGSCCGCGLEWKYDAVLLVMNLMPGTSLPERRLRSDSCLFLGLQGCQHGVRHTLCADSLCPDLEDALGQSPLIRMQTVAGDEIGSAFLLYEAVKKVVLSSD